VRVWDPIVSVVGKSVCVEVIFGHVELCECMGKCKCGAWAFEYKNSVFLRKDHE